MKIRRFFSLLFIAISCFSCAPEFSQNADYQDVTISYGILNAADSIHYIKVYKAFLTEGNAITEAGKLENISYFDDIDVVIKEFVNNRMTKSIPFYMTYDVPKDSGIFAYNPQVVYYSTERLRTDAVYQLEITNQRTGKVVTAKTPMVGGNFYIMSPLPNGRAAFLLSNNSTLKFPRPENADSYDVLLKFYYTEVDKSSGEVVTPNGVIAIPIQRLRAHQIDQSALTVETRCNFSQFYSGVRAQLSPNERLIRYPRGFNCIEIEVWAAEQNYMIYLDANTESSSIVQDRLEYTNMETADGRAYGLFSSRAVARGQYNLINYGGHAPLDSLIYGSITGDLGFQPNEF